MSSFTIRGEPTLLQSSRQTSRRERKKASRRERIVRAASRLFAGQGYAETGMGEVAAAADLAVGTLYNYFGSKPDLLLAIAREETEDLLAAGERLLEREEAEPREAVAGLVDGYVDALARHDRTLWRELVAAALRDPGGLGARFFELDARLVGQLTALLERYRARGRLAAGVEAGRAAVALYGVYLSWLMTFLMSEEMPLSDVRREVARGIETVLGGVLAPGDAPARGS